MDSILERFANLCQIPRIISLCLFHLTLISPQKRAFTWKRVVTWNYEETISFLMRWRIQYGVQDHVLWMVIAAICCYPSPYNPRIRVRLNSLVMSSHFFPQAWSFRRQTHHFHRHIWTYSWRNIEKKPKFHILDFFQHHMLDIFLTLYPISSNLQTISL